MKQVKWVIVPPKEEFYQYSSALTSLGYFVSYKDKSLEGYSNIQDVPYGSYVEGVAFIHPPESAEGQFFFCTVMNTEKEVLINYKNQEDFLEYWEPIEDKNEYGSIKCKMIKRPLH